MFDREQTSKLLRLRDRDATPFFAGRANEIDHYVGAFEELDYQPGEEAVFRIFQGAPGSGKTALLHHLRKKHSEGVLLVGLKERHLSSEAALMDRIREVAIEKSATGRKITARLAQAVSQRLRMKETGDAMRNAIAEQATDRIVLYMDEAQLIGPSERPALLALHRDGIGTPTVCLFTGLGHTAERFKAIGLSRLAANAILNMGAMAEDECAESTRDMLDALGASGDREHAAQAAAKLSLGWPQHLKGVQTALCRELLQANGELDAVDFGRVEEESDRNRHDYYNARLAGSVLATYRDFTATVVAAVQRRQPVDPGDLIELCGNELSAAKQTHPALESTTREAFANALVECGVLSSSPDERYEVAIPSMGEWLKGLAVHRPGPADATTPERSR